MTEIVPYPPNPNYGVTRNGRVYRIVKSRFGRHVPFEVAQIRRPDGYRTVGLTDEDGRDSKVRVNRMVAVTFLSAPPSAGLDAAHKNGVRHDNRDTNLYWGTRTQNMADCVAHGTRLMGERVSAHKLTTAEVVDIRRAAARGVRQVDLCATYNMSPAAICQIIKRDRWRHVA